MNTDDIRARVATAREMHIARYDAAAYANQALLNHDIPALLDEIDKARHLALLERECVEDLEARAERAEAEDALAAAQADASLKSMRCGELGQALEETRGELAAANAECESLKATAHKALDDRAQWMEACDVLKERASRNAAEAVNERLRADLAVESLAAARRDAWDMGYAQGWNAGALAENGYDEDVPNPYAQWAAAAEPDTDREEAQ